MYKPSIFNGTPLSSNTGNITLNGTLTTSNPWITIPTTTNTTTIPYNYGWQNPLKNLIYSAIFEIDEDDLLSSNLLNVKKNKLTFSCNFLGNRIQPYEFIMNLIEEKTKFSVRIKVSNILTICYTNFQFMKIENNFNFTTDGGDFSELKVKFKYEKIIFENHKLSKKEARADKLKKLINQE